jgi:pyruvate/2-oxoglutarate dehydrogenase complex dihydrolipoamide acyltransferase (E2) component
MELVLPALQAADWGGGGGVTEVEVAGLLVDDGTAVTTGQPVIELTLDKANVTVEAPADGVIRWQVQVGDLVLPGHVVATIDP